MHPAESSLVGKQCSGRTGCRPAFVAANLNYEADQRTWLPLWVVRSPSVRLTSNQPFGTMVE